MVPRSPEDRLSDSEGFLKAPLRERSDSRRSRQESLFILIAPRETWARKVKRVEYELGRSEENHEDLSDDGGDRTVDASERSHRKHAGGLLHSGSVPALRLLAYHRIA